MITSLPVWGVVLSSMNRKKNSHITILAGLPITNPALAFLGALSFFSLAGIPPLAGFYAKVFVFFSAIKASLFFIGIGIQAL